MGYTPLEPMGIHRECSFARRLSPHSNIYNNSDYLAAQLTQPRQTHANLVALCKCSFFGEEVHDNHRAFDRESRDAVVAATGSDTAFLRDPPPTDAERRARGHRTLLIKQVSCAFQQSRYTASDIRSETERTNGEPARYASIYTRRHPHLLVAIFADVSGDDPSTTIDPQKPLLIGYPLMTPLNDGDASQGHLSDIALMNQVEQHSADVTIRLTADPHYRIDPPMEERAVGRFSPEARRSPSVGELGHDLRQFFASLEGANVELEIAALRSFLETLTRGYTERSGGGLPQLLRIFEQSLPTRPNPCYEEKAYPSYMKQ